MHIDLDNDDHILFFFLFLSLHHLLCIKAVYIKCNILPSLSTASYSSISFEDPSSTRAFTFVGAYTTIRSTTDKMSTGRKDGYLR